MTRVKDKSIRQRNKIVGNLNGNCKKKIMF